MGVWRGGGDLWADGEGNLDCARSDVPPRLTLCEDGRIVIDADWLDGSARNQSEMGGAAVESLAAARPLRKYHDIDAIREAAGGGGNDRCGVAVVHDEHAFRDDGEAWIAQDGRLGDGGCSGDVRDDHDDVNERNVVHDNYRAMERSESLARGGVEIHSEKTRPPRTEDKGAIKEANQCPKLTRLPDRYYEQRGEPKSQQAIRQEERAGQKRAEESHHGLRWPGLRRGYFCLSAARTTDSVSAMSGLAAMTFATIFEAISSVKPSAESALRASSRNAFSRWALVPPPDMESASMALILSLSSMTIFSAVFFPTPLMAERRRASALAMARESSPRDAPDRMARAIFGPTPLTSVSLAKSSRSACVAKPYSASSSSRTTW